MRKPDQNKIDKILNVLHQHKTGIWIRELARQTKLPVSTLHFYLYKYVKDIEIKNLEFSGRIGQYKIVKLK